MPCLNEEQTIAVCIEKAQRSLRELGVTGEVLVVDNGSTDRSREIAAAAGARVVHQPLRGYGNAYHKGMSEARGRYLIMGDADDTYDFSNLRVFLDPLRQGYEFVIGNRFTKDLDRDAMPWLHRYVGTPLLSGTLRWWFNIPVKDAHCGMRAFTRAAYDKLQLQTTGMEYASEMIVNAGRAKLTTKEIPIPYLVRKGESKLRTFRDGWRHLRFMLLYSPRYLFILPGLAMFTVGLVLLFVMYVRPIQIGNFVLDLHPMFLASLMALLGYQIASLGLYTKLYSFVQGLDTPDHIIRWFARHFKLEHMIVIGLAVFALGVGFGLSGFLAWIRSNFGALFEVKKSLVSLTVIMLGVQTVFSAFFYSILTLGLRRNLEAATVPEPPAGPGGPGDRRPAPFLDSPAGYPAPAASQRLRIAFVYDAVYPYTKGGVERRIYELAERLARKHDVHVFTMQWWSGDATRVERGVTYHGVIRPTRLWRNGLRRLFEPLLFSLAVFVKLWPHRFDLLDCASIPYVPVVSCYAYSRLRRVPFVVTWHEFWGAALWRTTFGGLTGAVGAWSERLALRCSPQIVSVSPFTARKLTSARRIERLSVIANGVDYERIVASAKTDHHFEVLFAGRMIREKRVDLLLEALVQLPIGRRPRCLLIGEGQERGRLEAMAHRLGLDGSVEFRNFVAEPLLYGFMKGAKVFVLPSEREGFGITVLEAQACGTPTIVLRHPENAAVDLVQDGVNGYQVEANAVALARRLDALVNDTALADQLRDGARRSARGFDWGSLTDELEDVYRWFIQAERTARLGVGVLEY